jgi:hypothetical protein
MSTPSPSSTSTWIPKRQRNALNRKVPRGDHLVFEGTEPLPPNTHVATDIDAERFVSLLIARLSGK